MQRYIEDVRRAKVIIKNHGGKRRWLEQTYADLEGPAKEAQLDLIQFWTGAFKKEENLHRHVHENGIRLSYPKAKANLLKL